MQFCNFYLFIIHSFFLYSPFIPWRRCNNAESKTYLFVILWINIYKIINSKKCIRYTHQAWNYCILFESLSAFCFLIVNKIIEISHLQWSLLGLKLRGQSVWNAWIIFLYNLPNMENCSVQCWLLFVCPFSHWNETKVTNAAAVVILYLLLLPILHLCVEKLTFGKNVVSTNNTQFQLMAQNYCSKLSVHSVHCSQTLQEISNQNKIIVIITKERRNEATAKVKGKLILIAYFDRNYIRTLPSFAMFKVKNWNAHTYT